MSFPEAAPLISLTDVNKTYRTGDETLKVLDDVNLTIYSGEFVAIVGPSGSGKSTLSNVIGGLDKVDSGRVVVSGLDLGRANDRALSRYRNQQIGFVFQSFNLRANHTSVENVTMPLVFARVPARERKARAEECLQKVGLGNRLHHKASQLSGGQRQRVAIARALVTNPSCVIADEPTGNLDSTKGVEIMTLLRDLNEQSGVTLIVVTHDLNIAQQANRVLRMQDGVVTEELVGVR